MIDKDTYKRELVRMWDSIRDTNKGSENCSGIKYCVECPLFNIMCENTSNAFEMIEAVEKWSKEHPPKKHKISQLEYDILKTYDEWKYLGDFSAHGLLMNLREKGYFKGATDTMPIIEYFNNCEVKEDV